MGTGLANIQFRDAQALRFNEEHVLEASSTSCLGLLLAGFRCDNVGQARQFGSFVLVSSIVRMRKVLL